MKIYLFFKMEIANLGLNVYILVRGLKKMVKIGIYQWKTTENWSKRALLSLLPV